MRRNGTHDWLARGRTSLSILSLFIAFNTFNITLHGQSSASGRNRLAEKVESFRATGRKFETVRLFNPGASPGAPLTASRAAFKQTVTEGAVVTINDALAESIVKRKLKQFTLPLPSGEQLELIETDYSKTRIEGPNGEDLSHTHTAKHYQGVIKGDPQSLAAVSIVRDPQTGKYEVLGTYSDKTTGNSIIGKIKGDNPSKEHAVYAESKLTAGTPLVECGRTSDGLPGMPQASPQTLLADPEASMAATAVAAAVPGACVRIHLEVEYDVYQVQGANTANYATGFHNIAQTIYANENIPITLNYLKIWTSPNPEASISGYSNIWNAFWNRKYSEGIIGDLAMLVGLHIDRGIASLNTICGPEYNRCGISPIRDYPSYPTYSWASATYPHEIGHLFGSPHTQACSWNGNNTPLDGCVAPEGSCAQPSNMTGTIMSYCSNFSFANGFGAQPGNLIRNSFNNATCLIACGSNPGDTTPPTVSLTAPAAGASVTGTVTLSATATDAVGVTRVEFYVDGALAGTDTTSPYSLSWNSASVGNGTHSLTARAYDAANNVGTSAARSVNVSNSTTTTSTPLSNGVGLTINGATGTESRFHIDVPAGARNLVIAMSGGTGDGDLYTRFNTAPTQTTYDCRPYLSGNAESCTVATPSAGRYHVMVRAYSAYSGVTLRASFTSGSGDTTAPTVSLTAPANGASVTGNVTLSATASDAVGVSRVEFYVDGALVGTDTTSPYSLSWNSAGVTNGTHSVTARAYDAAGNVGTSAARSITTSNGSTTTCTPVSSSLLTIGTLHCVPAGSGTQYMYFVVPAGKTSATITTSGGTGNGDLYISPTNWATTTSYTQRSVNAGNSESITASIPAGTTYFYVSVTGTQSGMTIRVQ